MTKPIVVVGSINLDLVANSERIPSPGETVSGKIFNTYFGGKGANQAVAVARLGHPVIMIGKVGEDVFGSELEQGLKAAGVDTRCIQRVRRASGVALIVTDKNGENSIVVVPGANGELAPNDLDRYRDVLLGAGIILTQLEIPLNTVEHLANFAREHKIPFMLDPAPARPLPASLLQNSTWITPNEIEMNTLEAASHSLNEKSIAEKLATKGVQNLLIKLGSRGVLLKEKDQTAVMVPGFSVNAIDTTAAGDAFNGAFAVGLVRGKSAHESAEFANAVAAISVTRAGAQTSMPTAKEVEVFLRNRSAKRNA
ncbi:MAG TPA: ribokinase [Terriglobales bacterium]|jgi:ribokinase